MKLVKVDKYYDSRQVCVDATVAEAEKTFATNIFQSADDKMYANICDPDAWCRRRLADYADTLRRKCVASADGHKITRHNSEVGIMDCLMQCSRVKFLGASEQFARRQRNAIGKRAVERL